MEKEKPLEPLDEASKEISMNRLKELGETLAATLQKKTLDQKGKKPN